MSIAGGASRFAGVVAATRPELKLQRLAALTAADEAVLRSTLKCVRQAPARHDLIREGDRPGPVFVILSGWACRYKILADGTRQVVAFLMAGDWSDVDGAQLAATDHGLQTLSPTRYVAIPRSEMIELLERPQLQQAFRTAQLIEAAISREWMVNHGRRDARARVAHLFCELYLRAADVGLACYGGLDLPISQIVLADALGLTPVHVNRVLADFGKLGIVKFRYGLLTIGDWDRLARWAGFDDKYLHRRTGRPEPLGLVG